jgi:hypothetical protein
VTYNYYAWAPRVNQPSLTDVFRIVITYSAADIDPGLIFNDSFTSPKQILWLTYEGKSISKLQTDIELKQIRVPI